MTSDPERIEDEIRNTRARIDMKLDELETKLSPSRFLNAALGDDNQQITDFGAAVVKKARENPLPAMLIGAGVAGLFLAARSQNSHEDRYDASNFEGSDYRSPSPDAAERIGRNAENIRRELNELRDSVSDSVEEFNAAARKGANAASDSVREASERVRAASDRVASFATSAAETLEDVPEQAREFGKSVSDGVRSGVDSASRYANDQVRATRHRADSAAEWIRENPVSSGLIALAVGAVAASIMTAKKPSASVDASRRLHRAARKEEYPGEHKGARRFEDFQDAAEPAVTSTPLKTGATDKAAKPKPVRKPSAAKATGSKPLKGPVTDTPPDLKSTSAGKKKVEQASGKTGQP